MFFFFYVDSSFFGPITSCGMHPTYLYSIISTVILDFYQSFYLRLSLCVTDLKILTKTRSYNPPLNIRNRARIVKRFFTGNQVPRSHREQLLPYDSRWERIARSENSSTLLGGCDARCRDVPVGLPAQRPKFVRAAPPPPLAFSPRLFVTIARDIILLKAI